MNTYSVFRSLAYNNRLANHHMMSACGLLSQADFEAPRTGFFPSIKATLNHIFVVDHYYVDAMEGGTLGPAAWADEEPFATVKALQEAQAAMDLRLISQIESFGESGPKGTVQIRNKNGILREDVTRVLLHLFQHQIHHRGQAHAMLSGTIVAPPQLDDFFLSSDAPGRAAEIAALGWSEEEVWRT